MQKKARQKSHTIQKIQKNKKDDGRYLVVVDWMIERRFGVYEGNWWSLVLKIQFGDGCVEPLKRFGSVGKMYRRGRKAVVLFVKCS